MNTETRSGRLFTELVALLVGLLVVAVVMEVVGTWLFTRTFEQGPLSIVVAGPGAVAVGAGVGLLTRRLLRHREPTVTAGAAALALAGGAHLAVGGAAGVYADVANSPFRDLVLATVLGLSAGVVTALAVYRHLTDREDRPDAVRGLLAVLAGLVAGIGGAAVLFVGLTAALDPYIWPAPIVTGPVAVVAGLVLAIVVYRRIARGGPRALAD